LLTAECGQCIIFFDTKIEMGAVMNGSQTSVSPESVKYIMQDSMYGEIVLPVALCHNTTITVGWSDAESHI
jgi:hypothetical protein